MNDLSLALFAYLRQQTGSSKSEEDTLIEVFIAVIMYLLKFREGMRDNYLR